MARAGIRCSRRRSERAASDPRKVRFPSITTPTSATIKKSDTTIMNNTSTEHVDTTPPEASRGTALTGEISVGTDAAYAQPTVGRTRSALRNISEVRHFFRTNEVPVYFVGATPFNLLGLDRWVRNFSYVTYYDGWDGAHPRVFSPKRKPYIEFSSGEEINNWLLVNPEVRARIVAPAPLGQRPKVAMVFFDAETKRICDELGYDLILPAAELREHLDSKLVTTRLGNEVGAASVPNVLITVREYQDLLEAATNGGLGTRPGGADGVRATPGKTTFFIDDETGWKRHQRDIIGNEIKVMKRINNRPVAVEAVITRNGTIVGPFMSELTGHAQLTPYRGGWCGNEMFPEVLTEDLRRRAGDLVGRLGNRLGAEGYRGFFEVDVLVDTDTDEVYLGELNPRISGVFGDRECDCRGVRGYPLVRLSSAGVLRCPLRIRRRRDQYAMARVGLG